MPYWIPKTYSVQHNLRSILFAIWNKHFLKFQTNIFCNFRRRLCYCLMKINKGSNLIQRNCTIWNKYILQFQKYIWVRLVWVTRLTRQSSVWTPVPCMHGIQDRRRENCNMRNGQSPVQSILHTLCCVLLRETTSKKTTKTCNRIMGDLPTTEKKFKKSSSHTCIKQKLDQLVSFKSLF